MTVVDALTFAEAARIVREAMKDKSYQLLPLGEDAATYLRHKRKRLTDESFQEYESCMNQFVRYFADLRVSDFEPPVGTQRLEEFLDQTWGKKAARTYNKNRSIIRDFFKFHVLRGELHGDPTLPIDPARARDVHRTTFTPDQIRGIIASQDDLRDRLALRLLLDFALRKGALGRIQFKHFDHYQRRLTIFTKGGKVRVLPIPSKPFWNDLERYIIESEAKPNDYLMARHKMIPNVGLRRFMHEPMSGHGLHAWWYKCLERAGVVDKGVQSGERMHKARHTAGQRVLNATGNLKAVQKLLGHASIQTTGDIYADWDIQQLADTMAEVLADDE